MQTYTVATTDLDNVDWRVAGTNLAEECYRRGGTFGEARRLMLRPGMAGPVASLIKRRSCMKCGPLSRP
jgi:hypothetical protein